MTCIFLCAIFLTKGQQGNAGAEGRGGSAVQSDRVAAGGPEAGHAAWAKATYEHLWLRRADSLLAAGRYFEAGIAYERVLFGLGERGAEPGGVAGMETAPAGAAGMDGREPGKARDNDRQDQLAAIFGKTACLKQQGLFDQAVRFLEGWLVQPFSDSSLAEMHAQQIICTYLGGHFENTVSITERWPYLHPARPVPPLLVVLRVLSLNELQRWNEAGTVYHEFVRGLAMTGKGRKAGLFNTGDALAVNGSNSIAPIDLYAHLPHLKDTVKAGWLSTFIPGAGQWYAGRPVEGMVSLLVQAGGIYFAVLSFEQHYYVSGLFVGAVLFASFHTGGVRRAQILVQQYNRKAISAFNDRVKEQLLGMLRR